MTRPALEPRLGSSDAVVIGLDSMIRAGVFAAFSAAAEAAGAGRLIGLGTAAVVAYCNVTAPAQLAAPVPNHREAPTSMAESVSDTGSAANSSVIFPSGAVEATV